VSRAGFTLDLDRCVGCGACVIACRIEHGWPDGAPWRRIVPFNLDRVPGGPTWHFSVACHHCEDPACLRACPSGAYERRADGTVLLHGERCLGCRYCEMACPFGAPVFDERSGIMMKCDFCHERVERGLQPACISACPTGALTRIEKEDEGESPPVPVPGFIDPARCLPALRFREPGGALRRGRLERLRRDLEP
jgi:Fe-S-cluster-containing dehydrogenase component